MTRAVELAPSLWEVNYSRAFYTFYFERDWREAEPHFRKATAINPRSSLAEVYGGLFLALAGNGEEAVAHTARARELDPLSPLIHGLAGAGFSILGRFGEAAREATKALELQTDYLVGLWLRGLALSALGRNEEAIEALERTATLSRAPVFVGVLGLGYARAGRSEDATRLLRELEDRAGRGEYVPRWARLSIHVGRGDLPAMRRALATSLEEATPPLSLQLTGGPRESTTRYSAPAAFNAASRSLKSGFVFHWIRTMRSSRAAAPTRGPSARPSRGGSRPEDATGRARPEVPPRPRSGDAPLLGGGEPTRRGSRRGTDLSPDEWSQGRGSRTADRGPDRVAPLTSAWPRPEGPPQVT